MGDLIRREDAVSRVSDLLMFELQGKRLPTWNEVYQAMNDIPSAEPEASERTAKVVHKQQIHIVTPKSTTVAYETETNLWTECGNCGAMGMYHGWKYCPKCGAKLDWSE